MKVVSFRFRNLMGIDELEIKPGKVTRISGPNGSGKTSAIEGLRSFRTGGHDVTLLRNGEESGEAFMLFDDGTEVRKRFRGDDSDLRVRRPDGDVTAAQTWVNRLFDALSFDPVKFLEAKPEKRIEALLDVLPIEVAKTAIEEAAPDGKFPTWATAGRTSFSGRHAIRILDDVRESIFKERAGVNATAKDKQSTADELLRTVPEAPDVAPDVATARADRDSMIRDSEAVRAAAEGEVQRLQLGVQAISETAEHRKHLNERDNIKIEINKLETMLAENKRALAERLLRVEEAGAKLQEALSEKKKAIRWSVERERDDRIANNDKVVAIIDADLRLAEEARRRIDKDAAVRKIAFDARDAAEALAQRSRSLTGQIGAVESIRRNLLSNVPITGVDVRDGELWVDDGVHGSVTFNRLNLAQRIRLSLEVARLRAAEVPFVAFDDAEHLDAEHLAEFEKAAVELGVQLVYATVSNSNFAVEVTQ